MLQCSAQLFSVSGHTDWGSVTMDDATQNAALGGILFLAGGVGKDSPHFVVTLVGSDPTVRPTALDPKQASSMLNQRLQLVQQQKVRTLALQRSRPLPAYNHASFLIAVVKTPYPLFCRCEVMVAWKCCCEHIVTSLATLCCMSRSSRSPSVATRGGFAGFNAISV